MLYNPRDLKSFSHILSVINADPSATFIGFLALGSYIFPA
nr:MAG TPA: hypothetical protein [Caudoviricetes sp.]